MVWQWVLPLYGKGPVLANLFMGFHEKQWLSDFTYNIVLLYRRYVDDIICLFYCENDAIKFFDFLNTRHPNYFC